MTSEAHPRLLWQPSPAFAGQTQIHAFMLWLKDHKNVHFTDYQTLWQWSVDCPGEFWESIWQFFDILSYTPYRQVLSDDPMPHTRWFEGSTLNYVEHLFKFANPSAPAIIFQSETNPLTPISWNELRSQVAAMAAYLRSLGVTKGDRVVAFLPNIPQATVAFMATCSIGAIWSSCSPDFGANSILDRFQQIEPKVLFAVDGYFYNGKPFDRMEVVETLYRQLPSLEMVVLTPYLQADASSDKLPKLVRWDDVLQKFSGATLSFEPLPFDHPIWVLYSSGTTGLPKAITHSHGGSLLEHYKYLAFHNDVHPGDRFFWFSTTGWMMWNFTQAALLLGATIVLYDGSPGAPNLNILWSFAQSAGINHFGTSAPYLVACMKAGLQPGAEFDLSGLKSLSSTGSPLPPEAFDWVYEAVKPDIWLCSMSGGTDVCTAFVGGCPIEPLYEGEIQCRALGCSLMAWDDAGKPLIDEVGEMVITQPMPSMPVFFWNDPDGKRYFESYFDMFPGVWRHGDWVKITPRGSLVIYGRSDATLNRQGVRIGTAEIYNVVNKIPQIKDSLVVNLELSGGRHYMPLFVVLEEGLELTNEIKQAVNQSLKSEYSPRHVPDDIIAAPDIPYTISGKKMEAPVKKILMGYAAAKAANLGSMRNPGALTFFEQFDIPPPQR